jgi:hypothetical protein
MRMRDVSVAARLDLDKQAILEVLGIAVRCPASVYRCLFSLSFGFIPDACSLHIDRICTA